MESPRLTIRLPAELLRRLEAAAKRTGQTRTSIVERALGAELATMEGQPDG